MQIGLGVTTGSISPNFSAGRHREHRRADQRRHPGQRLLRRRRREPARSYTRAGNFSFDDDGTLVTADGKPVQGYTATDPATGAIITTGQPADIVVPPGVLRPPVATTQFGTVTNLDAHAGRRRHVHRVGADLRRARHGARRDDHLHEHRRRRVELRHHRARRGRDRRHRRHAASHIAAGTVAFDAAGTLSDGGRRGGGRRRRSRSGVGDGATATDFTWALLDANGAPTLTGYSSAVGDLVGHAERRRGRHGQRHQHRLGGRDRRDASAPGRP